MKKFLSYTVAVFFMGILALSVMAFTDDDPKKQKAEKPATEQCEKHKDAAAGTAEGTEAKADCNKSEDAAAAGCPKAAECKNHKQATADAK